MAGWLPLVSGRVRTASAVLASGAGVRRTVEPTSIAMTLAQDEATRCVLRRLVEFVFDEVGDDFGVGFGDELVAFGDEGVLEGEVVFDDAVVDDDEGAGAVAVGVGVFFGGAAVGGPAGVADAEGAVEGGVGDDGFEVAELAGGAAEGEAFGASGYGDAGGVVAAVFEAAQAFNDDGDDGLGTDVTDNSTHEMSLVGCGGILCGGRCGTFGSGLLRGLRDCVGIVEGRSSEDGVDLQESAGGGVAEGGFEVPEIEALWQ